MRGKRERGRKSLDSVLALRLVVVERKLAAQLSLFAAQLCWDRLASLFWGKGGWRKSDGGSDWWGEDVEVKVGRGRSVWEEGRLTRMGTGLLKGRANRRQGY